MRAALLLCALAAPPAPGVRPLPAGGELITLPLAGPAWTEVRVALRTPADPPDRAGLGAVVGLILAARLGAEPTLAPTAAVTRSVEGLVVAFGAPPEEVPAALEAVLAALAPRPLGAAEVDAAVAAAVAARQDGLRDGAQLVQATLRRALSEQGPAEGEVVGLAEVTLADAQAALTGLTRRGGPGVVLVGRLPALGPVLASLEAARAAWGTAAGPEPTPAGRGEAPAARASPGRERRAGHRRSSPCDPRSDFSGSGSTKREHIWLYATDERRSRSGCSTENEPAQRVGDFSDGLLDVWLVDQPGRAGAHVALGLWAPEVRAEAGPEVMAAVARGAGLEARWGAPLLALSQTATVGAEPEALARLLAFTEGPGPDPAGWRRGVATATAAVALELRDAVSAADALALDRVDPGRTLRPVLAARIAQLAAPPEGLVDALLRRARAGAVILTDVRPGLIRRLGALPQVGRVRVMAWDQR